MLTIRGSMRGMIYVYECEWMSICALFYLLVSLSFAFLLLPFPYGDGDGDEFSQDKYCAALLLLFSYNLGLSTACGVKR
jgi:hypothetical protein